MASKRRLSKTVLNPNSLYENEEVAKKPGFLFIWRIQVVCCFFETQTDWDQTPL